MFRSVHAGFVLDKVTLGQVSLWALQVSLSISFHHCSIFTHVSCEGWTKGLPAVQFHKDIVSPHHNDKKDSFIIYHKSSTQRISKPTNEKDPEKFNPVRICIKYIVTN
jgi:hypothetical protein